MQRGICSMKKRTISRWKKLVWAALSRMKRASGICQRCGKVREPKHLDAHHLIPKARGLYAMFEPDNIVVMCGFYCHRNWWHGNSTFDEQQELIERWIGLERYYEIKRKSYEKCQYKEYDYDRMLAEFSKGVL